MKNNTAELIFLYILCLLTSIDAVCAQNMEDFNKLYNHTYLKTAHEDFPRALHFADSLYSISETPQLQAKSLMLTATLYQQKGEIIKSIEYAIKAEKMIDRTDDVNWKTRIYGFLATQYRIARLFTPSKEYVEKAKFMCQKIKEPQIANTTMGLIMQEMAYHEMALKHYKNAIIHIQQAQRHFNDIEQHRDIFSAENEQLLGLNYYLLGQEDSALEHYKIALDLSAHLPQNHVPALIYNGLANIYLNKENLSKAKEYLDNAQRIADKSHYLQLKKEVNETAYKYYVRINDLGKILTIKTAQDSILSHIYRNSADFLNNSYTMLGYEREQMQRQSKNKLVFLILGILIVLPIILYFVLPQFKLNPEITNVTNEDEQPRHSSPIETEGRNEESIEVPFHVENKEENETDSSIPVVISEQVVDKIMMRLEEFEKKHLYIKRNVSLSYLAIYCDTNAKYLSMVINSHKKKDFYNYINELRIKYVVEKLTNYPYYRRLKVAVLADEAGFSSQSKFAVHFKKVTSLSPSEFIKSLTDTSR
ncbi:AraC family transcriptional regulator [Sphingobacterium phlebotomi]|uniref:AraC family transcriptional regulator n=1 Tax=Sphingobacterium phlebotomi TaxID=2605433 RepID=A0A5D4H8D9_9SPHI|nr:helix-turn-helix domain-containing protein [Sphingobacterium phlebotomi]TYR36542.1 AraC family transcriptional regulator [Sphingobacterium phlebotomi]